ncbi:hypothetical protein PO909_022336 [Leuciscus waleckii]
MLLFLLVGLPFAILNIQHKTFKRGFFCNDDSIKYPYKEDTISYQLVGGVMIPITVISMIIGECLSVYLNRIKSKSFCNSYVACIYKAIGTFVFGAAMSQSLTDIAKYSIGRLRPHFLDVCKPDWSQINCTGGAYIEDFICNGDTTKVNEGSFWVSWPPRLLVEICGSHTVVVSNPVWLSSVCLGDDAIYRTNNEQDGSEPRITRITFHTGVFSSGKRDLLTRQASIFACKRLYLQARMQAEWARLLRPTLQFFLIAASIYTGLSRVSDYKHHWSDVLTGLIQGAIVALLVVFCVSDFFKKKVEPQKEAEIPHTTLQETPTNGNHYENPS